MTRTIAQVELLFPVILVCLKLTVNANPNTK